MSYSLGDLPGPGGAPEGDTFKAFLIRTPRMSGTVAPSYITVFTVARAQQVSFWVSPGPSLGGFRIPLSGVPNS